MKELGGRVGWREALLALKMNENGKAIIVVNLGETQGTVQQKRERKSHKTRAQTFLLSTSYIQLKHKTITHKLH